MISLWGQGQMITLVSVVCDARQFVVLQICCLLFQWCRLLYMVEMTNFIYTNVQAGLCLCRLWFTRSYRPWLICVLANVDPDWETEYRPPQRPSYFYCSRVWGLLQFHKSGHTSSHYLTMPITYFHWLTLSFFFSSSSLSFTEFS